MPDPTLQSAYNYCRDTVRGHYENFPVASWLLPRHLRSAVAVIYTFARNADDFADEGNLSPAHRLEKLDDYVAKLDLLKQEQPPDDPVFIALHDVIRQHQLPFEPFYDLLAAFRMDVTKKRYANFGEVMAYCRYSANPVGRLLLSLYDAVTPRNIGYADAICSALQLINFYQDISQDYEENDRIYIPLDEMQRFAVTEEHIKNSVADNAMRALMNMQIQRARQLLQSGAPLGKVLKGRIGFELRMIIMGGSRVLEKLHAQQNNMFNRPRLTARDGIWMLWKALSAIN